jgi:bacterial microcompartment shell protein
MATANRTQARSRPAGLRSTAQAGEAAALPSVEALGLIETDSIARGTVVADGVLKMAPVELLFAGEISPGKFVVLFGGDVGPTRASHGRGVELAGERKIDDLLLPQLHPGVLPAIEDRVGAGDDDALGTIETTSVASTVLAADRAAKAARITLRRIRLAQGLGGKGFVFLTGPVHDVEAAVAAAKAAAGSRLSDWSIIPRLAAGARAQLL